MNGLTISLGTMHVNSTHYYGPDNPGVTEDLITSIGKSASVEMYPAKPFTWKNHSGMQTFKEMMDYTDFTPYSVADGDIFKSVNRGPWKAPFIDRAMGSNYHEEFLYNPGKPSDRMAGWLGATVGSHAIEYVKRPAISGILIEGPEVKVPYSKFSPMTDVDIYVRPIIVEGEININEVGKKFSQNANVSGRIRNFLYRNYISERPWFDQESGQYTYLNDVTLDQVRDFIDAGMNQIRYVRGVGSGDLSQLSAEAATIYKSFLVLSTDLYDTASGLAEAQGLRGDKAEEFIQEYINYIIGHEVGHFLEPDGLPETISEVGISSTQEKSYGKQAVLRENTRQGQIFGVISRLAGAYAENKRSGRRTSSSLFSKLESGVNKYENDAEQSALEKLIEDPESSDLREAIDSLGEAPSDYEADSEYAEEGQTKAGEAEASEAEGAEAAAE